MNVFSFLVSLLDSLWSWSQWFDTGFKIRLAWLPQLLGYSVLNQMYALVLSNQLIIKRYLYGNEQLKHLLAYDGKNTSHSHTQVIWIMLLSCFDSSNVFNRDMNIPGSRQLVSVTSLKSFYVHLYIMRVYLLLESCIFIYILMPFKSIYFLCLSESSTGVRDGNNWGA